MPAGSFDGIEKRQPVSVWRGEPRGSTNRNQNRLGMFGRRISGLLCPGWGEVSFAEFAAQMSGINFLEIRCAQNEMAVRTLDPN